MTSPLIQRLLDDGIATEATEQNFDTLLEQHPHTLLFFCGDLRRHPESSDLAVILPELNKAFPESFQTLQINDQTGGGLQQRFSIIHYPSLVLMRGQDYLGTISGLQSWAGYCADLQRLLAGEPRALPDPQIPVIS